MLASGGAAGLAGSIVSCPSEHVRTKMMLQRRAQLAAQMGLKIQVGGQKHRELVLFFTCEAHACACPQPARRLPAHGWRGPGKMQRARVRAAPPGRTGPMRAQHAVPDVLPATAAWHSLQGLETYTGSVNCATHIFKNHGLKGLYRGMTSTVLRDIVVRAAPPRPAPRRAAPGCLQGPRCGGTPGAPRHVCCRVCGCATKSASHLLGPARPPARLQGYAWFFYGYEATMHALAGPNKTKADLDLWQVSQPGRTVGAPNHSVDQSINNQYLSPSNCQTKQSSSHHGMHCVDVDRRATTRRCRHSRADFQPPLLAGAGHGRRRHGWLRPVGLHVPHRQ